MCVCITFTCLLVFALDNQSRNLILLLDRVNFSCGWAAVCLLNLKRSDIGSGAQGVSKSVPTVNTWHLIFHKMDTSNGPWVF